MGERTKYSPEPEHFDECDQIYAALAGARFMGREETQQVIEQQRAKIEALGGLDAVNRILRQGNAAEINSQWLDP